MITKNWMEIKRAAEKGDKLLFPIGVIEEHGPHLPLGSDIYYSDRMCELVSYEMKKNGQDALIVPGYYWAINFCTGVFPGSFSLKPETMKQVLFEIFENLKQFGFSEVYCFNYHGDAHHVQTIVDAICKANSELGMSIKLVLEAMNLQIFGWNGEEDFLLVSDPPYPDEWFEEEPVSERELYDIHAGAFETALINYIHPELVNLEKAKTLKSASLTEEGLKKWLEGGEMTKTVVPLGYAGNPAGYEALYKHVEDMLKLQASDIAKRIMS